MIQANELRLENCLEQGKIIELRKNVCRIEYKSDKIRTALISYTDLKPIELTEEILLKCGFIREYGVMSYIIPDHPNVKICYETLAMFYRLYPYTYKVKHLHQLQNLYFALTGIELKINL